MKPSTDRRERPNVVPWPPIIFAGTIVAALVLEFAYPLDAVLPWSGAVRLIGAAAMLVGVVVDVAAMREMHRNRANIQPHRAATALVTTGPFALSRNPIYLANMVLIAGAGLAFGNAWLVLIVAAAVPLISVLAIRREEAHLAAQFGEAWAAYVKRTPRWLRLRP
jgi:protein-S-isoprenylcysteine O-methyltransferase Ste14